MRLNRWLLIGLGFAGAGLAGASVADSRVELATTTGRLPAYRAVEYGIGHSREFGSPLSRNSAVADQGDEQVTGYRFGS